ncbi:MAG TPA: glycosyltransferase [Anaerolineales bacterium]|nr:glycosyltransferase [Anaerolineales bacterium]
MKQNGAGKIAIFIPSLSGGGAERAMLNLAHGFADSGCEAELVLASASGPYLDKVHNTIRLVDLKAGRVLASLPNLVSYLRSNRPDALISSLDYANIVALWARRLAGTPSRMAINDQNTISRSAYNSARRRQRIVPALMKQFYPWADYVIGNSQGVADDLVKLTGLPPERIHILYNPVVTPELKEKVQAPLDHPWFVAGEPPVILAVGRLTKQKDFPMLLQAFAQVRQRRPARLMILGEGPDRSALETQVKQLGLEGEVSMPGFVENPYGYMQRATVFVLSSLWEGLPTVLIEALYCSVPVVSTDCPSGPREILRDGQYGQLVPMSEPGILAQAIETTLSGKNIPPPPESWRPYELETVVSQYTHLLLGN